MDSVTQLALGASVGALVMGKQAGRRAIAWGAACGTLPDLDVLIPMGGPVEDFTYHRSFSHSIFVLALLTPIVVRIILWLHPSTKRDMWRWTALVGLAFFTHIVLDCFTAYGTQIFWPFWDTPIAWSTIFIIDPLYTVPILFGVLAALIFHGKSSAHYVNTFGLIASTTYLGWTLVAKSLVEQKVAQTVDENTPVFTTPSPFNTLLWRVVVMEGPHYREGFYSLLDGDRDIQWRQYPNPPALFDALQSNESTQRLLWFSRGFSKVETRGSQVLISDLRMGLEPHYIFTFAVAEEREGEVMPIPAKQIELDGSISGFDSLWDRIWSPEATLRLNVAAARH